MNDASTALLTEHFSYTPLSLIDDVINSVNNLVYQAISSLENGMLNTPPERLGFRHAENTIPDTDDDGNVQYPEARLEIENGLHQLETLFEATVDKAFDKFEIYVLRNILTVPGDLVPWIRLSHHENILFEPLPEGAPTTDSVMIQRRKLRETRKLNHLLQQDVMRNDAMIAQIRSMLSVTESLGDPALKNAPSTISNSQLPSLSFLLADPIAKRLNVGDNTGPSHTPITTNTTFLLSQLPALRSISENLRARLPELSEPVKLSRELDTKRDQRRQYIDDRIRLHLERTGEVGARNSPAGGRKVEEKEVQALESVIEMLK
ncbi:hypothetical protein LOZ53_003914 [Ophidiomyces ophidiicola]|uniref:Uncharacterized protein n=1 Tax=Ophidiomyces ophidiicola TaxID=1387563 RepID=A0ACB8UP84_9EURO|nr:uncharacterized protein LOZ57_006187 [Ophidiomyces ophidiicola]KAI1912417.1 hypothetical protein LOZ64_004474 [Ophidiomyces ophidiicola]KAI1916450.1 hypothetical protein LOZ61_001107 [Ophidiomyces ophidiicola]KAI1928820.1 hypothetical protein LOZ60_002112 [Ophidiomyces ophidiicola]KAI1939226.1 hypothetical protein LOZ57_006187 [Ophidiomyces ophidiicola]KAI1942820.1 hypothetical protein LOZ62_004520 [Ophidiomyces ophidiicola]